MVQLSGTRVLIVGAGLMGSQIGSEYALGGHAVTFHVRDVEAARARVEGALAAAAAAGLASTRQASRVGEKVLFSTDVAAIDAGTELIVESVPEDIELKRDVLGPIARALPRAIIASNTSTLRLTDLGEAIGAPERTLGTHYWNPPLLMPPVEIVSGERTERWAVDRVRVLLEGLGKESIMVERDVPGFIWNRLQAALLRESLWLVENGVASPETVDRVVRSGLARRHRYTGPFETVALGGLASWERVASNLFSELSDAGNATELKRWLRQNDAELEAARKRRDDGLARELGES